MRGQWKKLSDMVSGGHLDTKIKIRKSMTYFKTLPAAEKARTVRTLIVCLTILIATVIYSLAYLQAHRYSTNNNLVIDKYAKKIYNIVRSRTYIMK